jgi:ATP-binding cassette subfamily B protein
MVATLGTFVAFQRYIQKMVWPMTALGMGINYYQRAVTSSARLREVIDQKSDVPSVESTLAGWKSQGRVSLQKLSFAFPGTSKPVLNNISIEIQPGERIAFLGVIGSGKSALLSLLPRLYPVQDGMLFVDGIDVNQWPIDELRNQIGYVSQEVFLFSDTVAENLAFGLREPVLRSGSSFIEEASRMAGVHEDLMGLASAYQTRLGERGVNLSGGQKQRLTIARAIARQPSILVLDDALSSVDVQTEEGILRALRNRPGRNTEIVAAHRISTIRDADRIVVLEGGEIRQMGTHDQLVADRRGSYRRAYDQQKFREDLEQYVEEPVL